MRIAAIVSIVILLTVGCVSRSFDYKYISLEQLEGIKVISYGQPELASLKFDREMPIRYELLRKDYLLIFELDKNNRWPSILVGSRSIDGSDLIVESNKVGKCGGFDDWSVQDNIDDLSALRYVWSPAFNRRCKVSGNEDHASEQVISFLVKGLEGELYGVEELPFILIKNGTYYENDSL